MEINNKYIGTNSSKLKKMSLLIKFVHEKIINNQEIKRLVYYPSKNPLSIRGKDYAGNTITQPDVSNDQVKDLITILPFNPDMAKVKESYVLMNIPNGKFQRNENVLYLDCYIISPSEYMEIAEGLRGHEIAQRISDMFDSLMIDDKKHVEDLGNLEFDLISFANERVSKTNDMIISVLRFKIGLFPLARIRK